jgi:predicted nucleic acid-binding protein
MKRVAVDTGPIVALLDKRDSYHIWARTAWAGIEPPVATCEAVITEACHLVRTLDGGPDRVLDLVSRGVLSIEFDVEEELNAVRKLMARFASAPMSFADACLVRMTELEERSVMTLDTDFRVYRRNARHVIPLVFPAT